MVKSVKSSHSPGEHGMLRSEAARFLSLAAQWANPCGRDRWHRAEVRCWGGDISDIPR